MDEPPFIAAQRPGRHEALDFPFIVGGGNLAEMAIFFTERCVIETNVLAAVLLGAGLAGAAASQRPTMAMSSAPKISR
ncbi:MAG: hypothetical protein LH610_04195 [Sphingomonas bacterium]|nr:hypothetical protein [Sphingomonas bacterium]